MKDLNLYLIRHGQTEWNLKEQMQGSQNSPLTQNGIEGAKMTGEFLKSTPFIQAYSSPQQRAVETRDYILSVRDDNVPTQTLNGLREMDFGEWEGQSIPLLRTIPEFNLYMSEPAKFDKSMSKGEHFLDVLERMQQSLAEIIAHAPADNGNILIVSHGTALRVLLCVLNGGDWKRHRDENYFPRMLNTSISLVNYKGDGKQGQFNVKYFNNTDHVPNYRT
ncbi:histidine phosphatase family protein [Orbaceae bacterium ac157xtp]